MIDRFRVLSLVDLQPHRTHDVALFDPRRHVPDFLQTTDDAHDGEADDGEHARDGACVVEESVVGRGEDRVRLRVIGRDGERSVKTKGG